MTAIWTEKYRPEKFDEVKGQEEIVSRVKAFVEQKNMPHLLFAGPAGVGKTTLALVTAKQLFGLSWRDNFLELNASDERGIDVVRVKVKDFARTKAMGDVPFKIILLDECDALTREAQQALRRTMEMFTKTTRFILSCNYSSKIIEPIQSRCAIFRFKPLSEDNVGEIIKHITEKEGLEVEEEAKKVLLEVSEGDCRRLENLLQSCAVLDKKITKEGVYIVAGAVKPKEVKEVLEMAAKGKFLMAREKMLEMMLSCGLSGLDMIKQIQREIWSLSLDDRTKMQLIDRCGEMEFRMTEGADEFVQIEAFLAYMGVIGNKKEN
ncbi:replication factor C small subunit [Candidatus Woesearchaeota archaeon]|nr:replication factor C small subunit [Candidatus Woesearchaeota archaeon]